MTTLRTDKNGRPYFEFKNVRVTLVTVDGEKDWAGTGRYLQILAHRVLAYRPEERTRTLPAVQIPINDVSTADEAILQAFVAMLNVLTGEHDTKNVAYN